MPQAWENRARTKRAQLLAAIPKAWRLGSLPPSDLPRNSTQLPRRWLSDQEILITETSALDILAKVRDCIWSAQAVTRSFCHRAAIAHQLVNCLTEVLFDDALDQARQLDHHRAVTGELKGPLHGLPVSFMDRFRVAGVETAAGYIGWLGKKESIDSESLIVTQMRALGAVPFCKTNMPISMMLGETSNNIFGDTLNPFVRHLSSGGAAGGAANQPQFAHRCGFLTFRRGRGSTRYERFTVWLGH